LLDKVITSVYFDTLTFFLTELITFAPITFVLLLLLLLLWLYDWMLKN